MRSIHASQFGRSRTTICRSLRLNNGTTLIADQFNNRVLIVSLFKAILFQYGMLNIVGNGPNQLNGPYNAMSICDYIGVTPPPGVECDNNNQ